MSIPQSADLFCHVVDNYGDAAIAWSLAQQLAARGLVVRLLIDAPDTLRAFAPAVEHQSPKPRVEVMAWPERGEVAYQGADLVIEVLAAQAPAGYQKAAAQTVSPPLWLIYEYLSAEKWVQDCHLQASPHPTLPLRRYFFYPGFTDRTGGLLYASDVLARRTAFQSDVQARAAFWPQIGTPAPVAGEIRVSFFGYENPQIPFLLRAMAESAGPITLIMPQSRLAPQVRDYFQADAGCTLMAQENVRLYVTPMLERTLYERLLWGCDINFVRGEDSLTAAVMAGRPLVWHIYPQDEGVHLTKLAAFAGYYTEGLAPEGALALGAMLRAWNEPMADIGTAWRNYVQSLPLIRVRAQQMAAAQ